MKKEKPNWPGYLAIFFLLLGAVCALMEVGWLPTPTLFGELTAGIALMALITALSLMWLAETGTMISEPSELQKKAARAIYSAQFWKSRYVAVLGYLDSKSKDEITKLMQEELRQGPDRNGKL